MAPCVCGNPDPIHIMEIRPLAQVPPADLCRLISGYTARTRYQVTRASAGRVFTLSRFARSSHLPKREKKREKGNSIVA